MKEIFADWSSYNEWLIQHYNEYAITSLNEVEGGKVEAEYMDKGEWTEQQKKEAN